MTNNPDMQPTVTEALKPCPFCGSDAMRLIEVSPLHEGKFRVSHDHAITGFDCYVSGPIRVGEAAAIAAWNARHRSQDTARSADVALKALLREAAEELLGWASHFNIDGVKELADRCKFAALTTPPGEDGRDKLLQEVAEAQDVQPYRGWNLGKLNKVAGRIREHLGLPSVRDLNPDIAKMQDAALANKDALRDLIAAPADDGGLREALRAEIINTPETADFMAGVPIEASHQRERWCADHDGGKSPFDWFWLIGYLSQKAASSAVAGDAEKAMHHTISTAAALANWHAALSGADNSMRPGIEPPSLTPSYGGKP